jgi:hypothetical protein
MYTFTPITPNAERARTVVLFFWIFIAVLGINTILEVVTATQINSPADLMFGNKPLLIATVLVAGVRFIGFILMAVFFIMWMRRAYHNLHKAGSRNLRHSEGWASGAWFVPILNFAWPLQIMRDIWEETQNVFRPQNQQRYEYEEDNITRWWWAMFLASGFVTQIASFMMRTGNIHGGYMFAALGTLGYVFAGILAVTMVKRISRMESDMLERAQFYYNWLNQQYAEQYKEQQAEGQTQPQQNWQPPADGHQNLENDAQAPPAE